MGRCLIVLRQSRLIQLRRNVRLIDHVFVWQIIGPSQSTNIRLGAKQRGKRLELLLPHILDRIEDLEESPIKCLEIWQLALFHIVQIVSPHKLQQDLVLVLGTELLLGDPNSARSECRYFLYNQLLSFTWVGGPIYVAYDAREYHLKGGVALFRDVDSEGILKRDIPLKFLLDHVGDVHVVEILDMCPVVLAQILLSSFLGCLWRLHRSEGSHTFSECLAIDESIAISIIR